MSGIFSIGTSGLSAAQAGLTTTQNNIANANTPGYHRQEIVQGQVNPQLTSGGYIGQGTSVDTVKRVYSQFLDNQVMQTESAGSYLDAYYTQVRQIDNLLADPNAGLTPALQGFFDSMQTLTADAASVTARQSVLSSGSTLVGRFDSLSQQLQSLRDASNGQITNLVGEVNAYSSQIADLNQKIALATSSGSSVQQPNNMMDQRDQLIAEMNKLVQVSVVKQNDGSYNLFIGSGQALIVGSKTFSLSAVSSQEDPDKTVVAYAIGSGGASPLADSSLTGGSLGGILNFRNGILDSAFNALGRVAVGLAQTFNAQHKLGVDLNGSLGGNFFNIAANAPLVQANSANTGAASLTASYNGNAGSLTTDNYRISYDGANKYSLTNLTSNAVTSALTAAQLQTQLGNVGVTLNIAGGAAVTGDKWLVLPTRYGASSVSMALSNITQIAAAAPIQTAASLSNTGTASIDSGAVSSVATLPTSPVIFTFNSGTGKFTSASGDALYNGLSIAYTSGSTIAVNGVNFVITGAPVTGDSFTISPNSGASFSALADNRNAVLLGQLQTSKVLANNTLGAPTATYQAAYNQLVGEVGNNTREYELRSQAQTTVVAQAHQEQQSFSGVNLDEEAANLLRYQQAYQASGKAMQIASTLFATLLSLGQ